MSEPIPPIAAVTIKPIVPWYRRPRYRVPMVLIGSIPLYYMAYIFALAAWNNMDSTGSRVLPSCGSSTAQDMVKLAIENGPMSKITNIKLLAMKDFRTKSSSADEVDCIATGITNAGINKLGYDFTWTDKAAGRYYVQVGPTEEEAEPMNEPAPQSPVD